MTGASGQLGTALLCHWRTLEDAPHVITTSRTRPSETLGTWQRLDLGDAGALTHLLLATVPDRIFHCGGLTRPVDVDSDPEGADKVNVQSTLAIAEYARAAQCWLGFASSDFVYSGERDGLIREDDRVAPVNRYGIGKAMGERAVLDRAQGLVARLALMYAPPRRDWPSQWGELERRLGRNEPVFGVMDEWRSPIRFADSAVALTTLARQGRTGVVHVAGDVAMSPHDLILSIRCQLGSDSLVTAVGRTPTRPRNLALDVSRLHAWLDGGDHDAGVPAVRGMTPLVAPIPANR